MDTDGPPPNTMVVAVKTRNGPLATGQAFGILALGTQAVLALCFLPADFGTLDEPEAFPGEKAVGPIYNYYIGVALMMFVGFGYLMTFLKFFGIGSVGFTMFITCLGVQVALIVEHLCAALALGEPFHLPITFLGVLDANVAVAAVLISFGACIGKAGPTQILLLTVIELFFYSVNKVFVLQQKAENPLIADVGGTIVVHVFGAYFGIAASFGLGKAAPGQEEFVGSRYTSDLFSLIGTTFLWLFWPSFVGGLLPPGAEQTKTMLNTVLALLSSGVVTFGLAPLLNNGKINTEPVQNAVLAGGVTIGATANFVSPFTAIVIGMIAGVASTIGFVKSPSFLADYDVCGVNNLHGVPGIIGGIVSVFVPLADKAVKEITTPGKQLLGLAATIAFAGVTGVLTGFALRFVGNPERPFRDDEYFECDNPVKPAGKAWEEDTALS